MSRVWNFSAGPAVLPEDVLRQAADEIGGVELPLPDRTDAPREIEFR